MFLLASDCIPERFTDPSAGSWIGFLREFLPLCGAEGWGLYSACLGESGGPSGFEKYWPAVIYTLTIVNKPEKLCEHNQ